ncbi:hypothetical protein [Natronorubrum sp. DTA7]|uniref:hypothetical protein n=1 Tax=Natronorubrum sp. DTA7 TaxID=3447016 RepID=UPI003F858FB5
MLEVVASTADAGAVADYALLTVVGVSLLAAVLDQLANQRRDHDHDQERGPSDG